MLKGKLRRHLAVLVVLGMFFSCINIGVYANDGGIILTGDVLQVAAGENHNLLLKNNGDVYAWGYNIYGQLGDNTFVNRYMPILVKFSGLFEGEKIISVSAGVNHSMALSSSGKLYVWGSNDWGQLGVYTEEYPCAPILADLQNLEPGEKIVLISAGYSYSMAVTDAGNVYSWGTGEYGQLGNVENIVEIPSKIDFLGLVGDEKIVSVSAGVNHSMAVTSLGNIYTWGYNSNGQLGDGTTDDSFIPKKLTIANENIISVSTGTSHSMALTIDGDVYVWGRNFHGQLGDNITENKTSPVKLILPAEIKSISAGFNSSLAITKSGEIYAWGNNTYGQLGDGTKIKKTSPTHINTGEAMVSVVVSTFISIAVSSTGNIYTWGLNNFGQLGDGSVLKRTLPLQISFPNLINGETIKEIDADGSHSIAVTDLGHVYTWGYNNYGQLGNGTIINKSTPTLVDIPLTGSEKVISVAAGGYHSIAVTDAGNVYTWGGNWDGQLGDDSTINKSNPTNITLNFSGLVVGDKIVSVAAGNSHSIAVTEAGDVYTWGNNQSGQLGDGTIDLRDTPTKINLPEAIKSIGAGNIHSLAVSKITGNVYTWGCNGAGQLGDGNQFIDNNTPTLIAFPGLTTGDKIKSIAAGSYHSLAVSETGNLYMWGNEISTIQGSATPIQIIMPELIESIAAGDLHSLAISKAGNLYIWGNNTYGQLGYTTSHTITPALLNVAGETIKIIAGGNEHSIAVSSTGHVYTWGNNMYGQLGDGLRIYQTLVPVKIKIPKSLNLNLQTNSTFDYALTASNIRNPYRFIYYISYDPAKFVVDDLCKTTTAKEVAAGLIAGTNINVIEHDTTRGFIAMTFTDNSISFTGILNNIIFKSISDGAGKISVVNYAAQ